ncbi:hypothetical protein Syun_025998 [Stephania yunnanensis]|uniref:O-methyltransferase C-terminal domain-containing protein n=1 Tax=Stephania yunnanensis TaxID=152371 RepID=A0AAP0HRT1_9MAGN
MRLLVHNGFFAMQKALRFSNHRSLLSGWYNGGDDNSSFKAVHGKSLWDFGLENLDVCDMFNEAMAADSRVISSVLVTKCKDIIKGLTSLVDVGGGTGVMGRVAAQAFSHIKCSVLDLPNVVVDSVLLKSDEDCLKILKRRKEAIILKEKRGKMIIIDIVLDPNGGTRESVELQLFLDF